MTLEEDAEEQYHEEQHHEEPDDEAPFDQRRRLGRGVAALRRLPPGLAGFVPSGPSRVASRIAARVKLVELSLFRGGGRGEPLASLSVRSLFAEVCAFDGETGTSTTHATIGALAIEDLRDPRARRRAVRGGYFPENVSASPEESTSTSASESVSGTAVDRIPAPLLAYEQTKGPAVNGSRGSATLQRLRLEVEPTFLLDVARVFVPTLAGGGGEAPELVLPDDVRMTPGETYVLDRDVALNGKNRRILADGVDGGVYVLDGRGHAIAIDADGLVGANGGGGGGGDDDEADFHPVIFVGPNCSLTIKNAVIETSSSRGGGTGAKKGPARGKALWPRLVRLAPGGRISASSRDKVSFASSHGAAVAPDKVTDIDKVTLVDGAKNFRCPGIEARRSFLAVDPRRRGELTINRGDPRRRTRRDRPRLWPRSLRSRRGIGRRRETERRS